MTLLYNTGRARGPILAKDPITRATFELVNASGFTDRHVAKRAGINVTQMTGYRLGRHSPSAANVSFLLEALGAKFRIEDNNAINHIPLSLNELRTLTRRVA